VNHCVTFDIEYLGPPIGNDTWESNGHVIDDSRDPERSNSWPPIGHTLRTQYLENGWR